LSDEGGKGEFGLKIPKQRQKVDPSGDENFTIRRRLIPFFTSCLFVTVDQGVSFLFERSGGVFGAICHTQAASNDRFLQKKFAQKSKHRSNFPLICGAVKPSKDPSFFIPGCCQEDSRARSRALSINIYGCVRDR
jgi:hypothetical protein